MKGAQMPTSRLEWLHKSCSQQNVAKTSGMLNKHADSGHLKQVYSFSGGNFPFSGGGAKPSKFPTKLSNFRQIPSFALEKAVFSPFIGQNVRKFVIFHRHCTHYKGIPID
jgi:hypothetical protein